MEESKNQGSKPSKDFFWRMYMLLLSVLVGLIALYIVPANIGDWWDIKKIDMLSDLRSEQEDMPTDILVAQDLDELKDKDLPKPKAKKQEAKRREKNEAVFNKIAKKENTEDRDTSGGEVNTHIKDYSPERTGLKRFFTQLHRRDKLERPVRIAVLGDSFVEADIFTDAIRHGLQQRYGGGGIGWVGMSSPVAGYRQSVRHQQKGWTDISLMDKAKRNHIISGHLYEAKGSATSEYRIPDSGEPFSLLTLYYSSNNSASVSVGLGDLSKEENLRGTGGAIEAKVLYDDVAQSSVRLSLSAPSGQFTSYGVALEQRSGISLDNMSLRGSSGLNLGGLDVELNKAFAEARPYDLIILQYGLNVANAKQKDYSGYTKKMRKAILHIRELYPQADIMLFGVSDRAQKSSGELRTMSAIELLDKQQRLLAESLEITYFSLLDAMRSLGGVVEMSKRGETSKDYTHLSHKGGRRLAPIFLDALELEKRYYDELRD